MSFDIQGHDSIKKNFMANSKIYLINFNFRRICLHEAHSDIRNSAKLNEQLQETKFGH